MELIVEYYLKQGFEYKKNQKKFVRKDKGTEQVVFISFLKSGTLVEAQLQWGINLLDFERVFAQLKGWSKKMDTGYTFGTELNQLPEARNAGRFYEFKLYNERSLEYDNPSLLKAAAAFATAYERYAIPFFHRYKLCSSGCGH